MKKLEYRNGNHNSKKNTSTDGSVMLYAFPGGIIHKKKMITGDCNVTLIGNCVKEQFC